MMRLLLRLPLSLGPSLGLLLGLPLGLVLLIFLSLTGCQSLAYYGHAAGGQIRLMQSREPVDQVLARLRAQRSDTPSDIRADDEDADLLFRRLVFTQELLDFADKTLAMPAGRRYRTYVELDRPYVVWNLFAAPSLSLEPHRWCYPIVGCAPYRGFFSEARAERDVRRLQAEQYEVYLGGVAAYSTLGWFDDSLLSTFIRWPEPQLAQLIFHELAHGVVWVKDDVAFNESFATFVGRQGSTAWFQDRGDDHALSSYQADLLGWQRLLSLLRAAREALAVVYESELSDARKSVGKAQILGAVGACYEAQREAFGGGRHDAMMALLNNALLVSLATYQDLVPAFATLFAENGGQWPDFFAAVQRLARLTPEERLAQLGASGDEQIAERRDDQGTDEVQCEALTSHGFYREASGAVDDDVRGGGHRQHESA